MKIKLNEEFFPEKEVLFIGYSGGMNKAFSQNVYRAFEKRGITVYPMNTRTDGRFDVKVYGSFDELPKIPSSAYLLLKRENTKKIVRELKQRGVKRILCQSSRTIDPETLAECKAMGLETAVACPMMSFGGGFHRLHGFFARVRA
jgi:acyl-CoA synthetase (NDP forming)